MKFFLLAGTLLCSTFSVMAAEDPSAVLSSFWDSTSVPSVTGASLTSLATALLSAESSWIDTPQYTSVWSAIYSAAPSATKSYFQTGGILTPQITSAPWWSSVPPSVNSALASYDSAIDSVAAKFIPIETSSSKAAAPAMAQAQPTGIVMAAAAAAIGAVGFMAAM